MEIAFYGKKHHKKYASSAAENEIFLWTSFY